MDHNLSINGQVLKDSSQEKYFSSKFSAEFFHTNPLLKKLENTRFFYRGYINKYTLRSPWRHTKAEANQSREVVKIRLLDWLISY